MLPPNTTWAFSTSSNTSGNTTFTNWSQVTFSKIVISWIPLVKIVTIPLATGIANCSAIDEANILVNKSVISFWTSFLANVATGSAVNSPKRANNLRATFNVSLIAAFSCAVFNEL